MLCLVFGAHLDDCQMGHIGPLFVISEGFHIQPVMQFPHSISGMGDPNEYRWCHWDESLYLAERNLKRIYFLAKFLHRFERGWLTAGQQTRRKQGHVGRKMRQFGMEFLAERFNKLSYRVPYVSDECITLVPRHGGERRL